MGTAIWANCDDIWVPGTESRSEKGLGLSGTEILEKNGLGIGF